MPVSMECPNLRAGKRGSSWCGCKPLCAVCGNRKHSAVHMRSPGDPDLPYDHEYVPAPAGEDGKPRRARMSYELGYRDGYSAGFADGVRKAAYYHAMKTLAGREGIAAGLSEDALREIREYDGPIIVGKRVP